MTLHEFTNHSSQSGLQARTPGRAVRLALALAAGVALLSPSSAHAQAPADKTKKPGLAYDVHQSIELGGHIKTGLELLYDPARNPTNLELLQQAQEIARDVGRPIATHDEARALYQLS